MAKTSRKSTRGAPRVSPGRPSTYRAEYAEQAANYCKLGATDADLANCFRVGISTIKRWQATYPEFRSALKGGKDEADDCVERSLYQRAIGFEYDTVKVFNANGRPLVVPYRHAVPPDVTAQIFWLKNRRPERWRDVHKHEHGGIDAFDQMSADEIRQFIAEETQALGLHVVEPLKLTSKKY